MGRRERPLDPTEGPVAQFAYELRKLRREAGGITYRAMARQAHYSAATLAQAAAGERLASLPVVLAYAEVCGGDRDEWERRWHRAAQDTAEESRAADDDAEAPYPGLARFEASDSERFFGRDDLVGQLVDLVRDKDFVVLTGPSGSGKSSLLRAGLIPRLRKTDPPRVRPATIRILTPGPHPARTHADALDPSTTRAGTVIVVDQFEEVFTLCADPAERKGFLDLLFTAVRPEHGIRVVVAVRADFYGHCARYRRLAQAAQEATLLVAPMSTEELRETIVKPAALGGLIVERTLTSRIIAEIQDEPGGLPLMSHALLETWRRRRGRALGEAAYDAAGGLHGAIARTAEDLYESLTGPQADTARRILLRLVSPGQGTGDTRRPTRRTELTTLGGDTDADTDVVLERLARARLITLDEDTVDLAHEAVLTAWPRLRTWIDEDRERLRSQHRLTEAAATWQDLGRDAGSLYRGVRLSTAEEQFGATDDLTPLEREFLDVGLDARRGERRGRRTRTVVLSVLVVLSLVAALVAWEQNQSGERRRIEAEARRLVGVAESLRLSDPVTAMRLSLAAWRVADLPETRSALLGAAAQRNQDVFTDPDGSDETMRHLSADGRTLLSVGAGQVTRWDMETRRRTATWPGLGDTAKDVGFVRADASWIPEFDRESGEERVVLRNLATGQREGKPLAVADGGVEMGASGRSLLVHHAEGSERRVQLWDARSRRKLLEITRDTDAKPDAATGSQVEWARLTAHKNRQEKDGRGTALTDDPAFTDATVSADDRLLALCLPGERFELWDVAENRRIPAPWLPKATVEQCVKERITFTPDGRYLGLIDATGFRAWDVTSGKELPAVTYPGLKVAQLSSDGAFLVASDGEEILVWRMDSPDFPVVRHQLAGETVQEIRVDTEAGIVRYLGGPEGSWGPAVHTLDVGSAVNTRWEPSPALAVEFGPDGRTLAVADVDEDGKRLRFRVLDGRTGRLLAEPPPLPCRAPSEVVAFGGCDALLAIDSTGKELAYGVVDLASAPPSTKVSLYDIPRRRVTTTLGADEALSDITFDAGDRSLLLSPLRGSLPESTRIWDLRRRTTVGTLPGSVGAVTSHPGGDLLVTERGQAYRMPAGTRLPSVRSPGKSTALAFSPDGDHLAVGDGSGRVVLWDGRLNRRLGVLADPDTTTYQYVSALAFSADGRTLAVAGDEGTLQLWDVPSRRRIGSSLVTPGDTVHALAFGPDGGTLYAAGDHAPLQAYEITPDRAARTVCRRVTTGLSRDDWDRYVQDVAYRRSCPRT
ncbi:nSTAND1 domain-containing NTPase [Streptomyces liliifuscus]|uniref:Helix-turn-helix domain-containing protein n=1 Tax=Streptomyces liliifuscus TaxID=2797636 RepID=A0A7T7L3T5_9ACTN|nr:helix-turn-helix domain-containing protein [Streptomyces liliifuscus]QQM45937.1 helix-turn-helix domain-containing protein [Streptomyces liliifuscus]